MTWYLASVAGTIPGISWQKLQQMSFPSKHVLLLSHKDEISMVIHLDLSLEGRTQRRTNVVQITGQLATHAMGNYAQQDSSGVERASGLLRMPFRLEANYIFLGISNVCSWSSSSGLPTSFCYHHLFTSTATNHGSTNSSARWEWNRIEQNDGRFIQYTTCWDPTTTQTPLSSSQRGKSSHWKYDPGCKNNDCV